MTGITKHQIALLLTQGAGILEWNNAVIAQADFDLASGRNLKATPSAAKLVQELAKKIVAARLECDFITLFVNRPATVALGRLLQAELAKRWGKAVGLLTIARHGLEHAEFQYYPTERDSDLNFWRLTESSVRSTFERRSTLLFTDLLRGADHEGIIRSIQAPAARRLNVRIVGLAALAIGELGARKRLREAAGNPNFPECHLLHLREQALMTEAPPKERPGLFSRLFGS